MNVRCISEKFIHWNFALNDHFLQISAFLLFYFRRFWRRGTTFLMRFFLGRTLLVRGFISLAMWRRQGLLFILLLFAFIENPHASNCFFALFWTGAFLFTFFSAFRLIFASSTSWFVCFLFFSVLLRWFLLLQIQFLTRRRRALLKGSLPPGFHY